MAGFRALPSDDLSRVFGLNATDLSNVNGTQCTVANSGCFQLGTARADGRVEDNNCRCVCRGGYTGATCAPAARDADENQRRQAVRSQILDVSHPLYNEEAIVPMVRDKTVTD